MSTDRDDDGISVWRSTVPVDLGEGEDLVEGEFTIGGVGSTLHNLAGHKVDGRIDNHNPDAPTDLTATATRSHFNLSWSAPAWAGTEPINTYLVEVSNDGVFWRHLFAQSGSIIQYNPSHSISAGKTRYFRVKATHSDGFSVPSNTAETTVPPGITSVSVTSQPISGRTYYRGENIEVDLELDRQVVVSDGPQVSINVGSVKRGVSYTGSSYPEGSDTSRLKFRYTVAEDESDSDGISILASNAAGTSGLVGIGSSIMDRVTGVAADRTYGALNNLAGYKVTGDRSPYPGAPTDLTASATGSHFNLSWSAPQWPGSTAILSYNIDYSSDGGANWTNSGTTSSLSYNLSHSQPSGTTWQFRVSASNASGTGPESDVASASVPPRITSVSITSTPVNEDTYFRNEVIVVELEFDRDVVVGGDPHVSLLVGSDQSLRSAEYKEGSGTGTLTFRYDVVEGDLDSNGISIHTSNAAGTHGLVGGSITDRVTGVAADRAYEAVINLAGHKVNGLSVSANWQLSVSSTTVTEGDTDGVTVRLSILNNVTFPTDQTAVLNWGGEPLSGGRFQTDNALLTIPAGKTKGTLKVVASGEASYSPPDTRRLTAVYRGTVIDQLDLTLIDDEDPPAVTFAVSQTTVTEGDEFVLTVGLTGPGAAAR